MDFAEKELVKYGWVKGEGLGKGKNGCIKPIKVKLKRDTCGVGLKPGEEFTSDWWCKAFNMAAKNIKVEESPEGEIGIETKKNAHSSLKEKCYDHHKKRLKYGGFLTSSSMQYHHNETIVVPVPTESSAWEERKDEDLSLSKKITDDLLFRACGRRTAHKGARHGLKLSGKLQRLEKQEKCSALGSEVTSRSALTTVCIDSSRKQLRHNEVLK